MPDRIIILAGAIEGPHLAGMLTSHNPDADIGLASDRDGLERECEKATQHSRLIAFCTSVIVPSELLARFSGPSYNFHPGPPEIPGRYPSVWAIYHGHRRFGVTAHEMKPEVDSGAIVAVDRFDVPENALLQSLDTIAFETIIRQFHRLSGLLAGSDAPLPHVNEQWSGRKYRKSDCDALCQVAHDVSAEELSLRRRACGVHFRDMR